MKLFDKFNQKFCIPLEVERYERMLWCLKPEARFVDAYVDERHVIVVSEEGSVVVFYVPDSVEG